MGGGGGARGLVSCISLLSYKIQTDKQNRSVLNTFCTFLGSAHDLEQKLTRILIINQSRFLTTLKLFYYSFNSVSLCIY